MLGLLLNDLHTANHIDTTALCQGLCTSAMLKKYMTGKKKPEKLLGDALWQRAGKSMEKFEIFLEQDEFSLVIKRANIQILIRHGKLSEAKAAIKDYEKQKNGENPLHIQFLCLQSAEIFRREKAPYHKQMQNLRTGIYQTIPAHKISLELFNTYLFSMLELLLLERYAFLLEERNPAKALQWYQALITYLTKLESDGTPRDLADSYRILPSVYYRQAELFLTLGQEEAALNTLNEGLFILRKRQSFEGLFLRMEEIRIKLLQKFEKDPAKRAKEIFTSNTEFFSLSSEIACLQILKEEFVRYGSENLENIYPDYPERAIFSVNHIFRERRLSYGISIEDMALLIDCDVRTLRDIESGKRMPQTRTKNKFFEYFGLPTWKYCASISTRTYSFHKESASISDYDYRGYHAKAKEIYNRITKNLDKKDLINQCFSKYWKITLLYNDKGISKDKYYDVLLDMLKSTLPKLNMVSGQCTLTEYERNTLRSLAWTMDSNDSRGIYNMLYEQYQKFYSDEILKYFFPEYYISIAYCLSRFQKLQHNFKGAKNILETALKQIHFLQDDWRLENLFMQYFQVEDTRRKFEVPPIDKKSDIDFSWIRYAYATSKLYQQNPVSTETIEDYLERHYGKNNNILFDLM